MKDKNTTTENQETLLEILYQQVGEASSEGFVSEELLQERREEAAREDLEKAS